MPLYDYQCGDCSKLSEILILGSNDLPQCSFCGSKNMEKLLAAHSSMSGSVKNSMPGSEDTACCGVSPGEAAASCCAGPGSCCGKNFA